MAQSRRELRSAPPRAAWGEFVALPENASALRAIRRLAKALGLIRRPVLPNPLVLHGPSGTGKTLLVQTLVAKLSALPGGVTAQILAAAEIPRPKPDSPAELGDLCECDLLAIEDLQHLPVKAAAVLCRVLDDRAVHRRWTVLTSSVGPAGLTKLPRRLTSRLAAGLVVQLEPLTAPARRKLLARAAKLRGVRLTDDALDWLAGRGSGGGIRPQLGKLEKLRLLGRDIVGSLDVDAVRELLAEKEPGATRTDRIIRRVAAVYEVSAKDLLGKCRQRAVVLPRQVAMYVARAVTKLSLPQIGKAFGGRDHTTVLHACRKIEAAMKADPKLRRTVRELKAELG